MKSNLIDVEAIPNYQDFLTLNELDTVAKNTAHKYGFELREIGKSEQGHPLYLVKAGHGPKKIFLWGFPHPNEPIGSLLIDTVAHQVGSRKELQELYTWYFMYTADPDGTKLNQDWFKGQLTLEKYFRGFYRQNASQMIDWTFPVSYKDFEWNTPLKETEALAEIIREIKPDVMYPLHNSGFGGAYFLSTKKFSPRHYEAIREATKEVGIPLHQGEPEEEFMEEIEKPFYLDFGFKEYYEHTKKIGRDPLKVLKHGDNSTGYLAKIKPEAITIKTEVPYFYSEAVADTSHSSKTRREIWLSFIANSRSHLEQVQTTIEETLSKLPSKSPWHYKMDGYKKSWETRSDAMKDYVTKDPSFDRIATKAEEFDGILGAYFYSGGNLFGQVRRAAIEAKLDKKIIDSLEKEIKKCSAIITASVHWKTIPIKSLVKLQAVVLNETLKELDE